jgi:hypothetical protein
MTMHPEPTEEAKRLLQLEHELEASFPQVPVDKVHTVVESEWMRYLHASVRDFVPVLVRRAASGQLRELSSS